MIYGITIAEEYMCTNTHENDLKFKHDNILSVGVVVFVKRKIY